MKDTNGQLPLIGRFATGGNRGTLRVIPLRRAEAWSAVLSSLGCFDFYHTPEYHAIEVERIAGSSAELIIYSEGARMAALPLIFRSIPHELSGPAGSEGMVDAVSVYGYCGWLGSPQLSEAELQRFGQSLWAYLHARGVVCVFSRLHPLPCTTFPEPIVGEVRSIGRTVAVDCSLGESGYEAGLAKGHRYEIKKLSSMGCVVQREDGNLGEFVDMYHETMGRLKAKPYYLFSREYLEHLMRARNYEALIYVARQAGQAAAMAIFIRTRGIVQYHLSCSRDGVTRYPATKLIIDRAIRDAIQEGGHWVHLGGGLGGQDDSLFRFKRGFSNVILPFRVWRWVIRLADYDRLARHAFRGVPTGDYFPIYRGD